MNLLAAVVLLLHGELVEFTTIIAVPVGVDAIGQRNGAILLLFFVIFRVVVPALPRLVSLLAAYLAGDKDAILSATTYGVHFCHHDDHDHGCCYRGLLCAIHDDHVYAARHARVGPS
jgi:hypothetical protein